MKFKHLTVLRTTVGVVLNAVLAVDDRDFESTEKCFVVNCGPLLMMIPAERAAWRRVLQPPVAPPAPVKLRLVHAHPTAGEFWCPVHRGWHPRPICEAR